MSALGRKHTLRSGCVTLQFPGIDLSREYLQQASCVAQLALANGFLLQRSSSKGKAQHQRFVRSEYLTEEHSLQLVARAQSPYGLQGQ